MSIDKLINDFKNKDKKACAKIITLVENETQEGLDILKQIYNENKQAYRIGITGPPGVGKSTLVNVLIEQLVSKGLSIGVLAIDPSSPFTGGAILGDRLRMTKSYDYDNVFVRSIASRGSLGGLSASTENIAEIMSAFGYDIVLIETVGVGQSELDIMEIADTVVVVLVPESGDSIQAMKAGIMEIGDIFVINKSDRDGADRAVQYIKTILSLNNKDWNPPVVKISAKQNKNTDELVENIFKHKEYLEKTGEIKKKRQIRKLKEVESLLRDMFIHSIDKYIKNIENNNKSPYEIASKIFDEINKNENMEDL